MRTSHRVRPSLKAILGSLMDDHLQDRAGLHRVQLLGALVGATSGLVHELQKERGLSSGFVAGAGRRFERELPGQRHRTDAALTGAGESWSAAGTNPRMSALLAALSASQDQLNALPSLRADVDAHALTPNAVVERYSGLIDRLLAVIGEVPARSTHPQVTLAFLAFFNFLLAKEYTGQLRALGSAVCAQGGFEPFQHRRFQTLVGLREESLEAFVRHVTHETLDHWAEIQSSEVFLQWDRLRHQLEAAGQDATNPLPDAEIWYQWSTAAMETSAAVETFLLDGVDQLCLQILAETRSAWEEDRESPEEREKTLRLRLERSRLRLYQAGRTGGEEDEEGDPSGTLVLASADAAEATRRWRQDLDRLNAVVAEVNSLSRQVQVFSLEVGIEAFSRRALTESARGLARSLSDLRGSLEARIATLRSDADQMVQAQELWHTRTLEVRQALAASDSKGTLP